MLPVTVRLQQPVRPDVAAVFQFLLQVNTHSGLGATLRVAGGWVRDTVMGRDANDIDICVESPGHVVTGAIFAAAIARYQEHIGQTGASVTVIKTNPEKSKHLETAHMKVLGFELEFCHLRHDDYTHCDTNRIPQVRPGSPLEDAQRRDFCCNTLFYNIHTEVIEDYCGGLHDIEERTLRCPLAPFATFDDDPLRILRGVRFSGQLGFSLHETVTAAVLNPPTASSAHAATLPPHPFGGEPVGTPPLHPLALALIHRVSRERRGLEFTKMFGGPDPVRCLTTLHQLNLLYAAVLVEAHAEKPGKRAAYDILCRAVTPHQGLEEPCFAASRSWADLLLDRRRLVDLPAGSDTRTSALLFALMAPPTVLSPGTGPAKAPADRVACVGTHWLKLPSRVGDAAGRMTAAYHLLVPHRDGLMAAAASPGPVFFHGDLRTTVFLVLKSMRNDPDALAAAVFIAALVGASEPGQTPTSDGPVDFALAAQALLLALAKDSDGFLASLAKAAPLIRGDELVQRVPKLEKKFTLRALEAVQMLQLHDPSTNVETAVTYVSTLVNDGRWS